MAGQTRSFKGKKFRWVASLPRRVNAEMEANARRKRGKDVRVIPIKGGYALYVR